MWLWFDTESWKEQPRAIKICNMVIINGLLVLWLAILVTVFLKIEELPIATIAESISISIGGFMNWISLLRLYQMRDCMTRTIKSVDEKIRAIPKDSPRYEKWWANFNKRYILEGTFFITIVCVGISQGLPQSIYMLYTGNLYYDCALPYQGDSYTLSWWIHGIYQAGDAMYSGINYALKEFTWVSLFSYLAVLYEVQADTVMELYDEDLERLSDEAHYAKLIGVIEEMIDLNRYGHLNKRMSLLQRK